MRVTSLAAACLVVAGCAKEPVEIAEAPPAPELTREDCYTVVLFDDPQVVEPAPEVPETYRGFLGDWTNGAWDGKWCHDLRITKVNADGTVELYDMHAPYDEWGQPATAFKRTARIDDNGRLRFRYGTESVAYTMVEGELHASRSGRFGDLEAVLVDPESTPVQMASAPTSAVPDPLGASAAARPAEGTPLGLDALAPTDSAMPGFELQADLPAAPKVQPAAKIATANPT